MRRKRRWLLAVAIGAAAVIAAWVWHARGQNAKLAGGAPSQGDAGRGVAVIVAPVIQRDVPVYLEGLGSVVAFNTVMVRSRVDGQLVKVAFSEGQEVRQGDLLAQVDPRPFEIQVRQAEAALARDMAQLSQARLTQSRYLALRKENLIAQDAVDQQTATVAQLEATTHADRSAVDNAKLQLSYTKITSPFNGRTGLRLVDVGNMIHANDPSGLVVITQLDPIAVLITLPEDSLPSISREMMSHRLSVDAFSRDGSNGLGRGEVSMVDNQINPTAGTIKMKAIFSNPERALWPNQFVKARVMLSTRKNAIVVPAPAVQRGPNGTFAFVVKKDKTAEARPIDVGMTQGEIAVVTRGLVPGEQVVVDGQYKLKDGARVIPKLQQTMAEMGVGGETHDAAGTVP
jgi:multidrug efflux system membrane fusion protein